MPLSLRLHTESQIPLEVDSLRFSVMREQSLAEISRTLIFRGNQQVECGDFFDVSGSARDDHRLDWLGDLSCVKSIGAEHAAGVMQIESHAGMHLGARMTGGEIVLHGNAGDWTGAEMKGGRIRIHGDAGNLAGAVYRGGRKGMTGGEIIIDGNAGSEIGHSMRRGLIAVGGACKDAAGTSMIAGSIFIFGKAGRHNGAGMKRGTIALFDDVSRPQLLPTFKPASLYEPQFLQLYFKHLSTLDFDFPEECQHASYQRYCGDLLELGKGEILTRAV